MDLGKFDGVLLVSDFDDTLYGSAHTVTRATRDALDCFRREGGRFTVATGRAWPTFTPQIEKNALILDAPVILSNGAAVFDYARGQYLRKTFLRPEAADDLGELSRKLPKIGLEFYHNEDIYVVHPNPVSLQHLEKVGTPWREAGRVEEIPAPYVKVILEGEHRELEEAQEYLLGRWGEFYEAIFSNPVLLDVTRKGATKGGMVAWLRKELGLKAENVYCVGDSSNDLSMLQTAQVGYAPANCTPDLRAAGAVILPDCDHEPIPALIADLEKRYG